MNCSNEEAESIQRYERTEGREENCAKKQQGQGLRGG